MSSTSQTSTESVREHEISPTYQKSLTKAFTDFTTWYDPTETTHKFLQSRNSSWQIVERNWNKMLEDEDSNNSLFRFILDKRKEFWDEGKSGMSYFSILRSSIKRQMKHQKIQYTYNAEENLKSSFMSLKKADAAHMPNRKECQKPRLCAPTHPAWRNKTMRRLRSWWMNGTGP
jgi:hypothetical protein